LIVFSINWNLNQSTVTTLTL